MQCAKAGAALYIEKPVVIEQMTLTKSLIFQKLHWNDPSIFMMRYNPIVQRLLSTPISNIFRATFEIGHDIKQWRQNWTFPDSYAANPDGGGVLLDLCHEIDLAFAVWNGPFVLSNPIEHPDFAGGYCYDFDFTSPEGCNIRVAMDYLAPSLIRNGQIVGLGQEINYDMLMRL